MKFFIIAILFASLIVPVFGQDANAPLYRSLNDSMNNTISTSTDALKNFNNDITNNDQGKVYAAYKLRYEALSRAISASEIKLDRLLYFNDTPANVRQERDRYQNLIQQLQAVQADYDNWLKGIQ
jgi:hypothetical protein